MTTAEIIIQIVSTQADVESVKLSDSLYEDLNLDSLDRLEIVMDVEDEFKIQILDKDAVKFKQVKDIVNFINKKESENGI